MTTDCLHCPLRTRPAFEKMTDAEVSFMRGFKVGELVVEPRMTILMQGSKSPQLFTTLSGWGIRHTLLPDGGRQVINFVMPGDLIGLQAGLLGEMQHSVESVSRMTLCVFSRDNLWDMFKNMPQRAYDMTWLAAREEHFLGDLLATVGRRTAMQRVSWGLITYFTRVEMLDLLEGDVVPMPYKQRDLADAFGLSLVHTNKTIAKLREQGIIELGNGKLAIHDKPTLAALANADTESRVKRPLL